MNVLSIYNCVRRRKNALVIRIGVKIAWDNVDCRTSSETQGQIVGPKTKIKTGGKKFDEQKYERKIRAPDWAEQSGASIRSAVWNWYVKSFSSGARIFLSYFCSSNFFPPVLIFVFGPTICPWLSEDDCRKEWMDLGTCIWHPP